VERQCQGLCLSDLSQRRGSRLLEVGGVVIGGLGMEEGPVSPLRLESKNQDG
jgi:hypothetical protein